MKSVSVVGDVPYVDRESAAFACMHRNGSEFNVTERFDAAGYCLDAVERIPAGAAVRFESRMTGADYVFGVCTYR